MDIQVVIDNTVSEWGYDKRYLVNGQLFCRVYDPNGWMDRTCYYPVQLSESVTLMPDVECDNSTNYFAEPAGEWGGDIDGFSPYPFDREEVLGFIKATSKTIVRGR